MKKIVKISILVAAGFSGIFLVSCSKKAKSDNKPSGNASVVGFWSGTFLNGSANESEVFKSDGTTVQYDFYNQTSSDTATCYYKGYGTYSVTGNTIKFSVTFPTLGESFNETATINTSASPNIMTGTYTGSQSGNFTFTKQ